MQKSELGRDKHCCSDHPTPAGKEPLEPLDSGPSKECRDPAGHSDTTTGCAASEKPNFMFEACCGRGGAQPSLTQQQQQQGAGRSARTAPNNPTLGNGKKHSNTTLGEDSLQGNDQKLAGARTRKKSVLDRHCEIARLTEEHAHSAHGVATLRAEAASILPQLSPCKYFEKLAKGVATASQALGTESKEFLAPRWIRTERPNQFETGNEAATSARVMLSSVVNTLRWVVSST